MSFELKDHYDMKIHKFLVGLLPGVEKAAQVYAPMLETDLRYLESQRTTERSHGQTIK